MAWMAAGIMAVVLGAPYGLRPPETATAGTFVTEQDVRTNSARHYSELLRLACANGWKFRRREAIAGFHRHFEELRLVLVDRGATIVPLAEAPELELTEAVAGLGLMSADPEHRGCFRGRWRKPLRKDLPIVPAARPVADQVRR